MTPQEIKELYKHLPHVKTVFVKGDTVYLVKIAGSTELDLTKVKDKKQKDDGGTTE